MERDFNYKKCFVEYLSHPKIAAYWACFTASGKHIWNCQSKAEAKKLIDEIDKTGIHPYTNTEFQLC